MRIHPLEPLSAAEVRSAVELLDSESLLTAATRIISIILCEPDKASVYAWPNVPSPDREASMTSAMKTAEGAAQFYIAPRLLRW